MRRFSPCRSGSHRALEGLLRAPAVRVGAAVVAHPHPVAAERCTRRSFTARRGSCAIGFALAALRFSFRGVGASEGAYDDGRGGRTARRSPPAAGSRSPAEGRSSSRASRFETLCALRAAPILGADVLFLIGVPTDRWTGGGLHRRPDPCGSRARTTVQPARDGSRDRAATRGWESSSSPARTTSLREAGRIRGDGRRGARRLSEAGDDRRERRIC